MKRNVFAFAMLLLAGALASFGAPREKYNFNSDWLLKVGDFQGAEKNSFNDKNWKPVTLPRAFNEDEAFKIPIAELTDTVMWYRKHFRLPKEAKGQKVFAEFEGVRMGADFYLNGHPLGYHENGVMAVGLDLTPYINYGGENVLAVRVDNDWKYKERETGQGYQWNNNNFNANYGGIPKNVWLHTTDNIYQTLPLYSNLGTTGTYIYATDIDVASRRAVINAESEVKNETKKAANVGFDVEVIDADGKTVGRFNSAPVKVAPGETVTLAACDTINNLNFWSWGYGYLYDVKTRLTVDGKTADEVTTRTGFRKTRFGDGKIWLNDRVLQMKGYAQRTSNEWPGVGMSVPAWMSDYSNGMLIDHNANFFRWMHVTAWKQDAESCDRVGVMQMLPAGDAEKDVEGRRWGQRKELMRDMIIYFRNHPSVIFYESGNESISRDHMLEMREIRDQYDPYGGRAIGSREMLDIREAEYGGEMLYVNLSEHHPMVQTEYCRDEGLRKYWDDWSYPYHKHGDGPLYRNADASAYNQNQDQLAVEMIRRWYDFYRERPGMGRRVNSGGAKIIFSDTQTHCRGAENYRRSGVVDPLRIPKDAYYAHKVMWNGWVDVENDESYIIGHWNYAPGVVKPVYVVSTGDSVALFVNGKPQGTPKRDYEFLFTFDSIQWEPGKIEAIAYDKDGKETSRFSKNTVGDPKNLKLTLMQGPEGTYADGADIAIVQVEVVDADGQRCPLANDMVEFTLDGPAEWRGGIAQGEDNYAFATSLPVECGITRVLVRSTPEAGKVKLSAKAAGLGEESVEFTTVPIEVKNGLSKHFPAQALQARYDRGPTPSTPSYYDKKIDVRVKSAKAGCNQETVSNSWDDNELSEWRNDGRKETAWITYELERPAEIDEINIKLTGWRQRSYPLEIFAGKELIWSGDTDRSLGYVHLNTKPVRARDITIRLKGATADSDAFGQIVEVVEPAAGELDLFKAKNGEKQGNELRIVEVNFLENLNK
ncbi:MAG: glycoside hydrolase family 2 protein [Bacteroides sp.]|nr:glycoside hydrolase family 2 protein [Bacteroides sp.]